MFDKILFIDTETGGLDPELYSLLSIGLVVWSDFDILDSTEILIYQEPINVNDQALEINQINLEEHKSKALNSNTAMKMLKSFISNNFNPINKITLAGHNLTFDVGF